MRVLTSTGSALYFLHSDHLGSVSLTTDGAGAVVGEQKYTAWGVVWSATGSGKTDIGFTGQRADSYINMGQIPPARATIVVGIPEPHTALQTAGHQISGTGPASVGSPARDQIGETSKS